MKTMILGTAILLVSVACSSENQTEAEKALEQELRETVENSIKKAEEFEGKLDELLTLEMASDVSGLAPSEAKKDHTNISSFESVAYEWTSKRMRQVDIGSTAVDVPANNSIELSWVKNTTLEQFKKDYHNPTPEELKQAQQAIAAKTNDMKAKGQVSTDQANQAQSEANQSISQFSVREVPNLGDYAVFVNSGIFGVQTSELKVFYKGLSFTISADLSNEQAYNDKKCIEAARKIISEKLQ